MVEVKVGVEDLKRRVANSPPLRMLDVYRIQFLDLSLPLNQKQRKKDRKEGDRR